MAIFKKKAVVKKKRKRKDMLASLRLAETEEGRTGLVAKYLEEHPEEKDKK